MVRGQGWMASMPITRITNCGHYLKRDSGLDAVIHPPQVRRLGYEDNEAPPLMRLHYDAMSYS